jgi:hypothetical protein
MVLWDFCLGLRRGKPRALWFVNCGCCFCIILSRAVYRFVVMELLISAGALAYMAEEKEAMMR